MASAMKRGCGRRKKGAIYSTCPLGEGGRPVEDFLLDPPKPLEVDLAPQGVAMFEVEGTWHLLDWVGSNHYPNVADVVEEVRRMGMSRRLPKTLRFDRLSADSRHFLVHSRAIVAHPELYRLPMKAAVMHPYKCPQTIGAHECGFEAAQPNPAPMCAGIWWEDVDGGSPLDPDRPEDRNVRRRIPCGEYAAWRPPLDLAREYVPGVFMGLPIWNLQVINDPDGGRHVDGLGAAKQSRLDVNLVDE